MAKRAKTKTKTKADPSKAKAKLEAIAPPKEQRARAEFALERGGGKEGQKPRYKRVRQLEALTNIGLFTPGQWKALSNYRANADMCDRTLLIDSLARLGPMAASGDGPSIAMLNAIRVTTDVERAAGSLQDILRAVIVEDMSLAEWAIAHGKSSERCREKNGKIVCRIEPTDRAFATAKLEIRMAATRVEADIDARSR